MAAPRIIDPTSFKAVMQFNKTILESACIANKDEARTDQFVKAEDRDQFVKAVFQYFVAQGGAEIMKQLVAIKHNPDAHHAIFQDNECKEILEQNWFFFISHFVNFGRPTFNKNGVCTDADQFDDFHHIHLSHSFDNFLYTLIGNRGFPSKHDLGLSIAISIRHDLVNLIIETFVQTLFNNEVSSPRDLADRLRFLEAEYSQLKEHLAAMPPQAKRQKPNPDSESELNMDDGNVLHDDALGDALDDKVSLDAQVATELNDVPAEQTTQVATELNDVPAEQTHDAHDATNVDAELNDVPAESDEVPAEETTTEVPPPPSPPPPSPPPPVDEMADTWTYICDEHNHIMSMINPASYKTKTRRRGGYKNRGAEMCKNLDEGFVIRLISDIKERIGGFEQFDVNFVGAKPNNTTLNTLCDVLTKNWAAITVGLAARE